MVNAFDITAIHETQQALRDSEERYRRIVETANEGIWLSDKEGHAIYVNERMSEMLGYTVEEIIGSSILRFIDPDLQQEAEKKLRARVNGSNDTYDFLLRTKDESELWTSISATPFYDENGNINSVLAMVTDITQRKFVEETLQVANDLLEARVQERTEQLERERNLLRTLIDSMPDLIYAKDLQHRFVLSNRANALALGCEHPEDLIGKTDADYYPEEIATQFRRGEEGIFSTGKALLNLEHSAFSFNGGFEWGFTNKVPLRNPDGDLVGLVGITHDITERRQTQAILEQKYQEEQRFQQHLRSLHQITVELTEIDDLEALYRKAVEFALNRLSFDRFALFLYDAAAEMAIGTFGTDTAGSVTDERDVRFKIENTGKFYQALVDPSHFYLAEDTNLLDGYSQPVGKGWNAVVALSHSDEHLGWITADNLLTGQAANYLQLELLAQYGVLIASILARKRAELTLRDSEARFRQLIDTMGGGVTMYDLGGRLIYVNDRMCQITGYKREELLEQSFLQVVDRVMAKELEEAIEQRDPLLPVQTGAYEVGLTRRDQRKLTLLVNGSPMYDGSGRLTGSFAVLVDITRQKEAEETLRRSLEREQELGRLKTQFVSTTSHEFRTPLAIILATTETIMRFHDRLEPEQLVNRLEKIRGQVYHLRQIMDDVLHLAKMQAGRTDFKPRTANLHALLEEIVESLNNSSEHTDRIHYQSDEQVINMAFDPRLMRQIMVNLISNALKYSSEDKFVDLHLGRENQHIVIHIQDHGIGIPADSMEHIFEPFHRASNVDTISGTGLGLAIVKEAVELHGGTITIDSVVNEGTLVTVRLPTNLVPIAEKDTTRRN
jgi:PAS domain S-box-containing protein